MQSALRSGVVTAQAQGTYTGHRYADVAECTPAVIAVGRTSGNAKPRPELRSKVRGGHGPVSRQVDALRTRPAPLGPRAGRQDDDPVVCDAQQAHVTAGDVEHSPHSTHARLCDNECSRVHSLDSLLQLRVILFDDPIVTEVRVRRMDKIGHNFLEALGSGRAQVYFECARSLTQCIGR